MKKIIISVALLAAVATAQAQQTMICQTISGQQFVWVGHACPAGSFFVSY